jgi:Ethanolamine utilization protein EutJ (predicted chaperonin)
MFAELKKYKTAPFYTTRPKGEYLVSEKASRKTLGPDIGTNSICWAIVTENENQSWETEIIYATPVRKNIEPDFIKAIHRRID